MALDVSTFREMSETQLALRLMAEHIRELSFGPVSVLRHWDDQGGWVVRRISGRARFLTVHERKWLFPDAMKVRSVFVFPTLNDAIEAALTAPELPA